MAREAGLLVVTTADERAIHRFAELVRGATQPTDAQIEECVNWKGDPKDPCFDRIEFARTVLARFGGYHQVH